MDLFKTRLETLVKTIRYHSEVYYRHDRSEISDAEYDLLVQEYNQLITDHPHLLTDELNLFGNQAVAIEDTDTGFEKVKHDVPMLSLDNVFSVEEHQRWVANLGEEHQDDLVDEWKFDGIALRLIYEDGKLYQVCTRGTGLIGEDITECVSAFSNIPLELPEDFTEDATILIDGEGVIELKTYHELNEVLPEPYITPRHAASGISRNRSLGKMVEGSLKFVAHSFPRVLQHDYDSTMFALRTLGFMTAADYTVSGITTDRPVHLPFAIDGIVTKVKNHEGRAKLGATARFPRWAIAYKFPMLTEHPKLDDVIWETGRTGAVTPVATFPPVMIAGVSVTRATLHNFRTFERENLRVGSTITVGMAGDIIPQFIKVDQEGKGRLCKSPNACPSCNEPLHYEGSNEEQIFLTCSNHAKCPAQALGRLFNFGSEHGMNIRGLGPAIIQTFTDRGLLNNYVDLYKLRDTSGGYVLNKTELNLLEAIEVSRLTTYQRFLTALGISGVAKGVAKVLTANIKTNEEFFDLLTNAEEMIKLKDIGFGIALEVAAYLTANKDMVKTLMAELKFESIDVPKDLVPVCVTGKLPFRRKALEQALLLKGVDVTNTVNSKTRLVVLGEYYTKHKETSANDLDIPVVLISVHPELTISEVVSTIMSRI